MELLFAVLAQPPAEHRRWWGIGPAETAAEVDSRTGDGLTPYDHIPRKEGDWDHLILDAPGLPAMRAKRAVHIGAPDLGLLWAVEYETHLRWLVYLPPSVHAQLVD
jgi:hypothetical protein